jgi:hypothetical protein
VRCDKTEPECFKCCKKGIKCSGQGIECRFSSHMKNGNSPRISQAANRAAGNAAKAAPRAPNRYRWVTVTSKQSGSSPDATKLSSHRSSTSPPKVSNAQPIVGPVPPDKPPSDTDSPDGSLDDDVEELGPRDMQLAHPQRPIQAVSPQARLFFNHCKMPPSNLWVMPITAVNAESFG